MTDISYNDSVPSIQTTKYLGGSGNPGPETNLSTLDGMGHVIKTQLSDPSGPDIVNMYYDGEGHLVQKYNPYRSTTDGISTYYYDALGRPTETIESDSVSTLQWCYNGTPSVPAVANCVTKLGSAPAGNWVDSTDENGNHSQRTSDSFGRLTEVMEPNGANQSPSMETDYGYDGLNNLLSVTQWGGPSGSANARNRSFVYDSLSRLTSATNPETGTVSYSYDANSNVATKTDARSVGTTYNYDALNRLVSKSYTSDPSSTPLSCYQYDSTSSSNGIGRLTSEWTQNVSQGSCTVSTGYLTMRALSYDSMGRLSGDQQSTLASQASGKVYSPAYTYDLAGNLWTWTDGTTPSPTTNPIVPITFTNTCDSAQHLVTLSSNWADSANHPSPLFSVPASTTSLPCTGSIAAPYTAFGALSNTTYGSGLTLNRAYDLRLRLACENDVGSNSAATSGTATVTITGAEQTKQ
jgi:YD repeat-containing protein